MKELIQMSNSWDKTNYIIINKILFLIQYSIQILSFPIKKTPENIWTEEKFFKIDNLI